MPEKHNSGRNFWAQISPKWFSRGPWAKLFRPCGRGRPLERNFWPPPAGTSYLGDTLQKVSPKCGVGVLTWAKLSRPGLRSFAQVKTPTPHSGETLCKPSLGTLGGLYSLFLSFLLVSSRPVPSVPSRPVPSRPVSSHHVCSLSCGLLQARCIRNCAV